MNMKMLFKAISLSFFVAALLIVAILYNRKSSQSLAPNSSNDQLVVGMMSGWPPFMSINQQGEFEGFDVDVVRLVGQKIGKQVVIKDVGSLSTLFLALEQGTIDLIFSGLDITQERQARMNMVPYCGQDITLMCLIFYKEVPQGIESLEDLEKRGNATVCVEASSPSERLIDLYPKITKKQLKSVADMILDIRFGKSTAMVLEPLVANRLFKKDPELKCVSVRLPKQLCIYGCGIAIKKNNLSLTKKVQDAVAQLKKSGKIDALEKRWNLKGE